jgi:hypothetical protein
MCRKIKGWVMVRVRESTHALLVGEIRRLADAMERGCTKDERDNMDNHNPRCYELTLDALIIKLVKARLRHRQRRTASLARRRAGQLPHDLGEPEGS